MVQLQTLSEGQAFRLPWRKPGVQLGRLLHIGVGSATVRIPRADGEGWDQMPVSLGTDVEATDIGEYQKQVVGSTEQNKRERSEVEKPVAVVHRICDEMEGSTRNEIVQACTEAGVNRSTALTQFYAWRKQHA